MTSTSKRLGWHYLLALVLTATIACNSADVLPAVTMQTQLGDITIEIDTVRAPVTGTNFLRYVDAKLYDGGRFFRSVTMENQPNDSIRIEVIQGGIARERRDERFEPILLERTSKTGLRHLDGTISVARAGPDTGGSEFFICIGDQPELDFGGKRNPDGQGFAAFGRVLEGMDVVRQIQEQSVDGQYLREPVMIGKVTRR
jgi:peptidyl-prolyl cis-trans isomerase A (cyclophilin A)